MALDIQEEIPEQLKHEPGLMLKCLVQEGDFTFVIPEVRVKFFMGRVCRKARTLRTMPPGEAVDWSMIRKARSVALEKEPAVFLAGATKVE